MRRIALTDTGKQLPRRWRRFDILGGRVGLPGRRRGRVRATVRFGQWRRLDYAGLYTTDQNPNHTAQS